MRGKRQNIRKGASEVYSRIVGYYRSVKNWNAGKKAEYKERRVFDPDSKPSERATCNSPVQRDCKAESDSPEHYKSGAHHDGHYDDASRVLLFARKNCPNCSPVRRALASNADFEEIDADSIEGMAQATKFEIFSTPTVLVLRGADEGAFVNKRHKKNKLYKSQKTQNRKNKQALTDWMLACGNDE